MSFELRARAKKSYVDLDDIFRKVNGITLQMSTMEYILTDGQKGMKKSSMPKLFQDAVAIYRNDRVTYEKMMSEAKNVPDTTKSIQDQYFSWLASQVSPAQLPELYVIYADIEGFCLKRSIIKKELFELTVLADICKVADTVESNRVFRFTFKKNLKKMSFAMRLYYRFMKEHPEFLAQAASIKPALEPIAQAEKVEEPAVKNVDNTINFASIGSLAFTQSTEFSYFGELRAKVSSWTQLYIRVTSCLLNDYPDTLLAYINRNISGQGRYDFADQTGVRSMVAPKKVQDNFYLETNIGAADIVGKIRKLLDLCNVDYRNLEVHYQKQGSTTACTVSIPKVENRNSQIRMEKNSERFVDWMRWIGSANGTIRSYLSAVGQSSKAANEYGICDTDLLLVEDANRLQQILDDLLNVPAFRELNTRQHNRFRAAVTKLIAYRSNTSSVMIDTQSEEKIPVEIPEETRVRYTEILSDCFGEDGYQPGRAIFRGRFKQYYTEKYGCNPTESDDRIDGIMSMVGAKRDGRIFPKQDDVQNDLVTDIVNDILSAFEAGATAIYIEAVFDKYQQLLADNLQIYNHNALASLLLAHANGKYTQYYSYLTNNRSKADVQEDLIRIMKSFHQPQDYAAIHEKAWFIPYDKMKNLLFTIRSIVNVAQETYFYAPNLPVSADELVHLSTVLHDELSYHSYITDITMMQLIEEKCPSIAINTDGYTIYGLRNCLGYILRNQFAFNGPIISIKGKELSMADVYAEFARDHETLQLNDLTNLSTEMNIGIYWDSVLSEMIRVSATELVRKDQIEFDVTAIDNILDGMCSGDYTPLKDMSLFLYFPNIGYPWNSYLLESYLFSCSKKFRLLHSSFIKTGVYGAMVRENTAIQDYRSLLVDVLSKSNALSSTKTALQYIVDKGYQQRRRYEGIEALIQEAKRIKEQRENQEK